MTNSWTNLFCSLHNDVNTYLYCSAIQIFLHIIFRSTNPEEGEVLAWDICERFIRLIGVSNDGQYFDESDVPSTVSIKMI